MTAAPDVGGISSETLAAGGLALGVELTRQQCELLMRYAELLQRWNRVYNLTAARDPADLLTHHLLDCLAIVDPMRRQVDGPRAARLLDVGSGAGLPGVVLAIALTTLDVTCIDAVGKKAAFVQQVVADLRLPNLHSIHGRVERSLPPGISFNLIASRAFASLQDFVELTGSALTEDGVWLAMKGKIPSAEIAALPPHIEVFHVERLDVPGLEAARSLVWMKRRR